MARPKTVYRGRRRLGWIWPVVLTLAAIVIVLIAVFFGRMQDYLVYTKDGLSIQASFTMDRERHDSASVEQVQVYTGDVEAQLVMDPSDFSHIRTSAGSALRTIHAKYVPIKDAVPERIAALGASLSAAGQDAMVIQLISRDGLLSWASSVKLASSYGVNGNQYLTEVLANLKESGIYLVADISAILDTAMAMRNPPIAMQNAAGTTYADDYGSYLDPFNEDVREYIGDIIYELKGMGFDEVMLSGLQLTNDEEMLFSQSMTMRPDNVTAVSSFAIYISDLARQMEVRISASCDPYALRLEDSKSLGQDLDLFFRVFDRVYVQSDISIYKSDVGQLAAHCGSNVGDRVVPIYTGYAANAGDDSWCLY